MYAIFYLNNFRSEKRLLESAVVEQARLLMSHDVQRSNTEPAQRTVRGAGATFDSQFYEAQVGST